MVWNVGHNFPGAKDTYQVPIDYPTVGYDTIIAVWFTDVFTSILAIQDALIGGGALFLPTAGGTMSGNLIVDQDVELHFKDNGNTFYIYAWNGSLWIDGVSIELWGPVGVTQNLTIKTEEAGVSKKLILDNTGGAEEGVLFQILNFEGNEIAYYQALEGLTVEGLLTDYLSGDWGILNSSAGFILNGVKIEGADSIESNADVEVLLKDYGFVLKSPNESRWRIRVSDAGALSTQAL